MLLGEQNEHPSLPRSGKTQRSIAYRLKASTVLLTIWGGELYDYLKL